jgi:hypothetical protein
MNSQIQALRLLAAKNEFQLIYDSPCHFSLVVYRAARFRRRVNRHFTEQQRAYPRPKAAELPALWHSALLAAFLIMALTVLVQ